VLTVSASSGSEPQRRFLRLALFLAGLTIAWNVIEAVVAISAGLSAGSAALVGFGLDSTVEVLSACVIAWQFAGELRGGHDEERERRALRLIAITFFVLATYVTFDAGRSLLTASEPDASTVGIGLAALSLVVMPLLAWAKLRVAGALASPTLRADAKETLVCTWLSAALLVGLALNAALGWWWADPVAALAIAGLAFKEGREAWLGDDC
jgi:divalent metal cation (Fe/Co/Zn/Cd) transporter